MLQHILQNNSHVVNFKTCHTWIYDNDLLFYTVGTVQKGEIYIASYTEIRQ